MHYEVEKGSILPFWNDGHWTSDQFEEKDIVGSMKEAKLVFEKEIITL